MTKNTKIQIHHSDEVAQALAEGKPVVALESTIITHGMPYPQNIETAREVEAIIRENGAVPATIAVLKGELHVGLSDEKLEELANAKDVMKASRADLCTGIAMGRNASTTVAATMMAAHAAGIRVFATGGVGGVHFGAETNFDISADLEELARTPVLVVSAFAKALLDLPKTLEVLETKGVAVIGYGCDKMPAFWSSTSDLDTPYRLDTPEDIAKVLLTREAFGTHGGELVANPVPVEDEIPAEEINKFIKLALADAEKQGIKGKAVTPFMLQHLFEQTDGRSLATNIALVKNNARLASKIAVEYAAKA
ncbi:MULTISPECIES: pseudouridine-5'-phosphate glycosidase [Pseudovibrio]|uniref:pseudouridine-5'-phosphate glycosidase n=1 Tax=Stappiaceae TaxID=2821832 RepID=UPI00236736E2|nr:MULTISPECIES: pseudouridine-5'-phosphate glycosidase [Pseudovibrio]MDD7910456.1 pseudouridine-5'-phosphate glycosidase [Pseudovibrio exalbescens]MDX5594171.1 pseudouridine-5'-phosphate glycosidase [Pseudovibrio sp. SPO723]